MNGAFACCLRGGTLKQGQPDDFWPFLHEQGHVISLVGGGGKTTLMYHLALCYRQSGLRTAIMTTTRMGRPQQYCTTPAQCRACWNAGEYAVCGQIAEGGKFRAPDSTLLDMLLREAQAVVIEADGARRLPCKAPAAHEPVILPQTDIVIGVMGLDALGERVDTVCLRTDRVMALLGCDGAHRLTPDDMAQLLLSSQGARKGVETRSFYVALNKCDNVARRAGGEAVLRALHSRGFSQGVLLGGMRRSEAYEYSRQEARS